MEYQVRDARITDVERITALLAAAPLARPDDARSTLGSTDLLRQLVYLPNAVVLVADSRRTIVGAAVLALRPSVLEGGMVGTIDLLVVDAAHDGAGIQDSLLQEALRLARNKGCATVEATLPEDAAERVRWAGHGFVQAGSRIVRDLAPAGAARH